MFRFVESFIKLCYRLFQNSLSKFSVHWNSVRNYEMGFMVIKSTIDDCIFGNRG